LNLHHVKRILTPSARRPFFEDGLWNFSRFYCTKTHVWIEITPGFWDLASHHFQVCYNTVLSIKRDQGVPHLTSPHAEGALWIYHFGKIHHIATCRPMNRLQASGRVVCNGRPIAAQHSTAVAQCRAWFYKSKQIASIMTLFSEIFESHTPWDRLRATVKVW